MAATKKEAGRQASPDVVPAPAEGADPAGNPVAERILVHARECFERSGFQKATIEDIAAAAGVVRQTIYNYFVSKQDIIDQITLNEMIKVQEDLRRRMRHYPALADKLTEAILLSTLLAHDNPYLQRIAYDPDASPQGKLGPIYEWQRRQWRPPLDAGRSAGELRPDLNPDAIVSWLSFCQWTLQMRMDQAPLGEGELRTFIRAFMVEPILANHGSTAAALATELADLRARYADLKDILAEQALQIRALERRDTPTK